LKANLAICCFASFCVISQLEASSSYGLKLQWGELDFKSEAVGEADKSGYVSGVAIEYEAKWYFLRVGADYGWQQSKIKGDDFVQGISQSYEQSSVYIAPKLEIPLFWDLYIGMSSRYLIGEGANYVGGDIEKVVSLFTYGPSIEYRYQWDEKTYFIFEYTTMSSQRSDDREVNFRLFGISYIYEFYSDSPVSSI